jgi:nucleotide-binding universal stress UspA family protein
MRRCSRPARHTPTMLKLLIAVDGSEHANHAIPAIARLAQETGPMEVLLVNVTGNLPLTVNAAMRVGHLQEMAVRSHQWQVLDKAVHLAHQNGLLDCTAEATSGIVAHAIVRVATQAGVDQIVMGTRGLKVQHNHFLGSVAHQVIQLASIPVLLVT